MNDLLSKELVLLLASLLVELIEASLLAVVLAHYGAFVCVSVC